MVSLALSATSNAQVNSPRGIQTNSNDSGVRLNMRQSVAIQRLILPLCLFLLCGCDRQDAERLDRIGHKVVDKIQGVAGDTEDKFSESWLILRSSWGEVSPDARVTARLRWDKSLVGASIQATNVDGVVHLHGTVMDTNQRQRALGLAQETAGVEQVDDGLEVVGGH
jgi:osmotically-inducible protein OsmY